MVEDEEWISLLPTMRPQILSDRGHDLRSQSHFVGQVVTTAWYLAELEGISALELQLQLELGSYEAAWKMLHKLRSAMKPFLQRRLCGSVVVDVAYVGGIRKGVRGNEANQQFVVGIATEIVTPGHWRHVRLAHIHDDSSDSILRFVCEVVEPGCHVHTDKIANKYLRDCGYRHGGVKGDPGLCTFADPGEAGGLTHSGAALPSPAPGRAR